MRTTKARTFTDLLDASPYTPIALSVAADVSLATIDRAKRGKVPLRRTLAKMAKALDVTPDALRKMIEAGRGRK